MSDPKKATCLALMRRTTRQNARRISAETGESMIAIFERLVSSELAIIREAAREAEAREVQATIDERD